jgi:Cu(I)/Ag(I) efflux system membrane fusion protein
MMMKEKIEIHKRNGGILKVLIICLFAFGGIFFLRTSQLLDVRQASSEGEKVQPRDLHVQAGKHEASGGASHSEYGKPVKPEKGKAISDKTVRLSPEMVRLSGIRTEPVQYRRLVKEIQTVGEITYDERRVKIVSAWIGGRIDKLFVDFTGVEVKQGDPLAELYSPELVSTQQEYLLALETLGKMWLLGNEEAKRSAKDLLEATRQRLLLWGISEEQIERIKRTRKVNTHMTIHAPIGGTVIHKRVHEGQYVKTGEALYTIADLSLVWAMVDIYEYEMAEVKTGQAVSITSVTYPGVPFTGKVSFIDPFLDRKTRTVKVRMDVPNPKLMLKPGMFVEARLKIPLHDQEPVLSVPHTAVLDTGIRKLVYVELNKGEYEPVEVRVGPRAGNYVPVLSGLRKGQRVASSANYLIDSQSTLGGGGSGGFGGSLHGGH